MAVVVEGQGSDAVVAQETAKGSVLTKLTELGAERYAVVHLQPAMAQRDSAVEFANVTLGTGYGYLSIVADAFNALTGLELGLSLGNRMVCSTQALRAAERMGLILDRSPAAATPAHGAWYFGVAAR